MSNRSTRRARAPRGGRSQMEELLSSLQEMQGALNQVSDSVAEQTSLQGILGPTNALGRRMESAAEQLSHLPGELEARLGDLRAESFEGCDRDASVTVTLSAACASMRIELDPVATRGLAAEELAQRVEEAHGAAAARYAERHRAAQAWVHERTDPIRGLVDSANAHAATTTP